MYRMSIILAAIFTFSVPFLSVLPAQGQPVNQQRMATPVYYRHPGQNHWRLLGTFPREMARRFAEQLRDMGFQARVGPLNF